MRTATPTGRTWALRPLRLLPFAACLLLACGGEEAPEDPVSLDPCAGDAGAACGADAAPGDQDATRPDAAPDPATWTSLAARPCPEDSFLNYYNFGRAFMLNWCTACHSEHMAQGDRANAPVGIDFNTVELVRTHSERVWVRSGDLNETMPPFGGPSAEERAALGAWLACGAP